MTGTTSVRGYYRPMHVTPRQMYMQNVRPGSTVGDAARRTGLTTSFRRLVVVQALILMFTQAPCVYLLVPINW